MTARNLLCSSVSLGRRMCCSLSLRSLLFFLNSLFSFLPDLAFLFTARTGASNQDSLMSCHLVATYKAVSSEWCCKCIGNCPILSRAPHLAWFIRLDACLQRERCASITPRTVEGSFEVIRARFQRNARIPCLARYCSIEAMILFLLPLIILGVRLLSRSQ